MQKTGRHGRKPRGLVGAVTKGGAMTDRSPRAAYERMQRRGILLLVAGMILFFVTAELGCFGAAAAGAGHGDYTSLDSLGQLLSRH